MAAKIGGSGGDKHTIEQTADINITPFIDILLVLMIIFMVAAPMATVSIRLDLPPAQPPTNPTEEKEPVYITIQENGQLFLSDKQTSIDNLATDVCTALGCGRRQRTGGQGGQEGATTHGRTPRTIDAASRVQSIDPASLSAKKKAASLSERGPNPGKDEGPIRCLRSAGRP